MNSADPPRAHECLTTFARLEGSFGRIVSTWMNKREQVGPGFYLYNGIRRGMQIYIENRFVTLVTGLEALHRKKYIGSHDSTVKERVARIIDGTKDDKDETWLRTRLKNAHEPNLEQRLFDIVITTDLQISREKLRTFAMQCAKIRNDLSHFGEQRNGVAYQVFIRDVVRKNEAPSISYDNST